MNRRDLLKLFSSLPLIAVTGDYAEAIAERNVPTDLPGLLEFGWCTLLDGKLFMQWGSIDADGVGFYGLAFPRGVMQAMSSDGPVASSEATYLRGAPGAHWLAIGYASA